MNHYVNLVQRGVSAQSHAVSGKTGKFYGNAIQSAPHGGVVLKMTLAEYNQGAHDLIGNTSGGQQWVPEFVTEGEAANRGFCGVPAGCQLGLGSRPALATHFWGNYLFCAGHAPSNAQRLDGAPSLVSVPTPAPVRVEEVLPKVNEPGAPVNLPAENLPPPAVASEDVDKILPTPPPVLGFPPPSAEASPPELERERERPAPELTEKPKAVDVIAQAVASALATALPSALADMESRIVEKLRPTAPKKKKPRTGGPDLAPTAFKLLQLKAKDLGINTYGKSKSVIEAEIAEAEKAA